jgi:tRNA A-37 threonylcarbamoyl transferase component Bud32
MLSSPNPASSVPLLAGARLEKKLAGGPTSDSWLFNLDGMQVVLRVDKPLARTLNLDRMSELLVLERVWQAGFGPAVIWADPVRGLLVTEYICGAHLRISDIRLPENIECLAARLRELHSSSIEGSFLDIPRIANHYSTITNTVQSRELYGELSKLLKRLCSDLTESVFCHNDLGHRNIIHTRKIMFLDWEYSAAGDPWFELAGIVRQNRFSAIQSRNLLYAYYGTFDKQMV